MKIYMKIYLTDVFNEQPEELTKKDMFFHQVEATVRTAFIKYILTPPKIAFVNKNYPETNKMTITLVRDNFANESEAILWNNRRIFVQDELDIQARSNSDEEGMTYKFNII